MRIYFIKLFFKEFKGQFQTIESVWESKIKYHEETFYKNKIYSHYERGFRDVKAEVKKEGL